MIIGNRNFDLSGNTYIMGILNITPDSFSDGGKWNTVDRAIKHAEEMINDGADIIDVGGESTRPGHIQISSAEETDRVAPVIEKIKQEFDIPVSVDTYKSDVAEASLKAGADLVNDIWGFLYDEKMAGIVKKYNAACCLMHNRNQAVYNDLIPDMINDLKKCIRKAKEASISDDKIILDPGIGFAKTYEMNLQVMKNLDAFNSLSYPMLLGTSRKSFIRRSLDLDVDQTEEGTLVTTVMAVQNGYSFVRVHDVEKNVRAVKMTYAILRS
jgi:dihydropteroate synthase